MSPATLVLGWLACSALAGCHPERRLLDPPMNEAEVSAPTEPHRNGDPQQAPNASAQPPLDLQPQPARYAENADAVAQGKRLYRWFNCNGCHAVGGGDMGPPLMDGQRRFGPTAEAIFLTIVEGRPNGMPSFGGRISEHQVWQIVAYVQSMSVQPENTRPGRADARSAAPTGSERLREVSSPLPDDSTHGR